MTNPTHYPSLELCRKLTEIRFPKTEKVYSRNVGRYISGPKSGEKFDFQIKGRVLPGEITTCQCKEEYPCPSVMEMLDVMPDIIKGIRASYYLMASKSGVVQYMPDNFHPLEAPLADYRGGIPNALAEMILWLHDNKHITFPIHD